MRRLIVAPEGHAIVMLDWVAQEIGIYAGRSQDPRMCADYANGDFHMTMAVLARLAPVGATKQTYPGERDRAKPVSLGTPYGITAKGVSKALRIPASSGREFLRAHAHHDRYPVLWRWLARTVDNAIFTGMMTAPMGWRRRLTNSTNPAHR